MCSNNRETQFEHFNRTAVTQYDEMRDLILDDEKEEKVTEN